MKAGAVICGPDVAYGPLALFSGTFEQKVSKAAALGYDGIELMVRDPAGLDWPQVAATLHHAGLAVPQIVTGELFGADGLCLVTPDDEVASLALARTEAVIDLAAFLGASVNIGRLRGRLDWLARRPEIGDDQDKAWACALDRLALVVSYAAGKGVRVTLEPINRYETDFIHTVADGLRVIEDIEADNLGLMLDLFHMNIEEASIEASLRRAGDHVWHIHIADSGRRYPGSGHIAFAPIFVTLREMGYAGYVSAELLPQPDPDAAAKKTIEFLRQQI